MAEAKDLLEEVEEKAGRTLGIEEWDRPAIFRDAAGAATDGDLPYWAVLILSGAIATLGLALNSSAVVIGAMLVAPLLSPVVGLAMALAVGDGRLALQTGVMVLVSTVAVVVTGALLTVALPFQTITAEISSRTQPTTLDLAIAVFSGLAGAVVTVSRGHRLSAAIPGVAISVALIPPLAVAGFGVGAGWNAALIRGSLLLYGANLAGIVLSGMAVFLLIGMQREGVLEAARAWHRGEGPTGLIAWVDRAHWVQSLGVIRSAWARIGLVLSFVVAVSIPLSQTLAEIARDARVRRAVEDAARVFDVPGRASVLGRQVVRGSDETQVYLRVATTEWFGADARERFERIASAAAGEPVRIILQQLPATGGDLSELAALFPADASQAGALPAPASVPAPLPELLAELRSRAERAAASLSLPDGVSLAGFELAVNGAAPAELSVGYAAPARLPPAAEQILARQLARALEAGEIRIRMVPVLTEPRFLGASAPDTARVREAGDLLRRYDSVNAEIIAGPAADSASVALAVAILTDLGVEPRRLSARRDDGAGLRLRLQPARGQGAGAAPPAAGARPAGAPGGADGAG